MAYGYRYSNTNTVYTAGAFYSIWESTTGCHSGIYNEGHNYQFGFASSRSNSLYGKSNTVQPPALLVSIWERVS